MKKIFFAFCVITLPLCAGTIDVERYSANSSLQWVWAMTSLRNLPLNGNESILDVGCGDGKITAYLASKVPQGYVVGVEPYAEIIEFAQSKYQNDNLTFEMQSAVDLPYVDQFDLVTSFLTLNWLQDSEAEKAVVGIAKALKPGGIGLLTIPPPAKDSAWREVMQKIMTSNQMKPYVSLFEFQNRSITVEKIQDWVSKAGLNIEYITSIDTPIVFHDRLEVKEWLYALNPRLEQMPLQTLDYFTNEYIKFISLIYPQAGDSRIYAFPERMLIKISKPIQ